jgi:2'-5' RNA ligase
MQKKYNLALIPTKNSAAVIALAQKFSAIADKYLLGEKSLPHVTLYQFTAEEKEMDLLWKKICNIWHKKPIKLTFNEFSYLTFDNKIHWLSLLPNKNNILHEMHNTIASILQLPSKKTFDPHMTLINTLNQYYKEKVAPLIRLYVPIADSFALALGTSDDIGQLLKLIHIHDPNNTKKQYTIKVTVLLENSFWVGIFERNDNKGYAVARKIFGNEPTDAELYDFILTNFDKLKFTEPQNFKLVIKRKNPKRMQREVRHEMKKAKQGLPSTTHAQETLRLDLEKNKKLKKITSKAEKKAHQDKKFQQKQEKKKKKHRGH